MEKSRSTSKKKVAVRRTHRENASEDEYYLNHSESSDGSEVADDESEDYRYPAENDSGEAKPATKKAVPKVIKRHDQITKSTKTNQEVKYIEPETNTRQAKKMDEEKPNRNASSQPKKRVQIETRKKTPAVQPSKKGAKGEQNRTTDVLKLQRDLMAEKQTLTFKDMFDDAINHLQENYVPEDLPCREKEKRVIHDFIESGLRNKGNSHTLCKHAGHQTSRGFQDSAKLPASWRSSERYTTPLISGSSSLPSTDSSFPPPSSSTSHLPVNSSVSTSLWMLHAKHSVTFT
jgi:hypothetical protein